MVENMFSAFCILLLSIRYCDGFLPSKHIEQPYVPSRPNINNLQSAFTDSVECGIREIALNFSKLIINRYNDRIYDALQLNECVNHSNFTKSKYKNHREYHQMNADVSNKFNQYLSDSVYNKDNVKIIEFYVDIMNGNDNNEGTETKPFAHIKTAKNSIKSMMSLATYSATQFIVYIRGGTYFEGTFEFGLDDNGFSASYPVIYTSYKQERVIISGGKQLKSVHFERYKNSKIMKAKLNTTECIEFDQLFINDTHRLIRARCPSGNPEIDVQPEGYAFSIGPFNGQQPHPNDAIYFNISTPSRNSSIYPYFGSDKDPRGEWEAYHIGGDAKRFADDKNFWNGTVPAGLTYNISDNLLQLSDSFVSDEFIANVFHTALWGNWLFSIDHINASQGQIGFNFGGFRSTWRLYELRHIQSRASAAILC